MTNETEKIHKLIGHLIEAKSLLKNISGIDLIGHAHLVETTKKIVRADNEVAMAMNELEWMLTDRAMEQETYQSLVAELQSARGKTIDLDEMDGDPMDEEGE